MLYCQAVEQAAETWKRIQQLPNYETVVGDLLFRQIFEIAPAALAMDSFGVDKTASACVPDAIFQSPAFQIHAKGVVQMLEMVMVMMLGDDMDGLAESLHSLGSRHVEYGVHPVHCSIVETALLCTLAGALGDQWTDEVRKGWAAVFKFISKAMISGAGAELEIVKDRRRKMERHKSATMRLKEVTSSGTGTSRLSRSGHSSGPNRSRDNSPPSNNKKIRSHRRHSDPPRISSRAKRRSGSRKERLGRKRSHCPGFLGHDDRSAFGFEDIIFENSTAVDVDDLPAALKHFSDNFSCDSSLSSHSSIPSIGLDERP